MKRHMRWSRVVALAFAACGGSSSPPAKLSDAFQESIQRQCQKAFDCMSSYVASMHQNQPFEDRLLSEVDLRLTRLPREPQANLWIMASAGSIDPAWEPFLPA